MNTRIIYNTHIKVAVPGTGAGCTVNVHLEEDAYKILHDKLETNKFITVINTRQEPVTINVSNIYKIDTQIQLIPENIEDTTDEE